MARKPKRRVRPNGTKEVKALKHDKAKRKNIPTAELQSAAQRAEEITPFRPVTYPRATPLAEGEKRARDEDLDPQMIWKGTRVRLTKEQIAEAEAKGYIDIGEAQLVWRGKDTQDWSNLVVQAPPIYIQEKIHPKVVIDDLMRRTMTAREANSDAPDLFADFNGVDPEARTEFYEHDQNWSNRMILGDSLQVMASLAEREGLRGEVQCIYFDPPYGIKFNSNWQVSTRSRDVKDGKLEEITREPEQVKAFRDTWKDGIHSYLTYLRDRLTAMRDLLTESGSIFVQIGDENVHLMRSLLDEVFGSEQHVTTISLLKTTSNTTRHLAGVYDSIVWFARDIRVLKYRQLYKAKEFGGEGAGEYTQVEVNSVKRPLSLSEKSGTTPLPNGARVFRLDNLTSQSRSESTYFQYRWEGKTLGPGKGGWKTNLSGMNRLARAGRLRTRQIGNTITYVRYIDDFPAIPITNLWTDLTSGFNAYQPKVYVVQTNERIVERCILAASDPGDLVLDPTCGSGTTAEISEHWGRRWITIDTSRVALALARARIMGARYPYYLLSDSPEGRDKEQDISGKIQPDTPTQNDIRQGFVYERAPHITLKSIANNAEIDVIWETYQKKLEPLRTQLNEALGESWEEWEIPRDAEEKWPEAAKTLHEKWWRLRIARQKEIDESIAKKADVELLYDRPYEDKSRVRVAGPFTVESLSPHRVIPADEAELIDELEPSADRKRRKKPVGEPNTDFTQMILENLKSAGVQQGAKEDKITFTSLDGWPGTYIAAEGRFMEGASAEGGKGKRPSAGQAAPAEAQAKPAAVSERNEKRAAIFIGPEFGTVSRADLTAAAREALDARFDALIACGFNFEAHTSELNKLGPLPILKAKMNPDLHMADELKNTGKGNLFIIFGEPDIKWDFNKDGEIEVEVLGIDVFDPKTGEVRASGKDDIAAWFIDTDYNEESFFVRHAYFLGAQDPYKSLKTSLKAEIDEDAWASLYRDKSRPFPRPESGRFAVKVINHFGDEVMKVFGV